MRAHYHVGYNTVGYLPEMDVYTVSSKRAAMAAAWQEARKIAESYLEMEEDEHTPVRRLIRGVGGDYYVDTGRSLDLHVWYEGPCTCTETEEE